MSKFFRTTKNIHSAPSHSHFPQHQIVHDRINHMKLDSILEDVEEKNTINLVIEKEIKTGFEQLVNTLKVLNTK